MPFRKETLLTISFALAVFGLMLAPGNAIAKVGEENKITCMYPVWVGYGPIHVAKELGYFKEEGIEVEEILDDDMPNGIAAMERGDIDCYLRTVGEYQGLGRRKTTQGIIIGTIDLSTGGEAGRLTRRSSPYAT
jgi:NitT/TauT family transport system substrate-binding protein